MVQVRCISKTVFFALIYAFFWIHLNGFVLISSEDQAHLDVTVDQPTLKFRVTNKPPKIRDGDKFMSGTYLQASQQELWAGILRAAMDRWSNIRGSYLKYDFELVDDAVVDADDHVHSIAKGGANFTTAALANPIFSHGIISDCDIQVSDREVAAQELAYTILHELGHCVGLGHNHTNYNAVMGYSRTRRTLDLGGDDMAGAIFLYPDPSIASDNVHEMYGCGVVGSNNLMWPIAILVLPALATLMRRRSNSLDHEII